jgi:hypothetical protein
MTSVVWENLLLAVPFVLAFAGIPLWMVNRRPDKAADFTQARAYLRAKAARPGAPAPVSVASGHGQSARQAPERERVLAGV